MHWGMFTSFWVGVYPTTLTFTKSLSSYVYLPALYSVAVGLGEIGSESSPVLPHSSPFSVGLFVSALSHRYPSFGLRPTMVLCVTLTLGVFGLTVASTPRLSSILPNDDAALLFEPRYSAPFPPKKSLFQNLVRPADRLPARLHRRESLHRPGGDLCPGHPQTPFSRLLLR